MDTKVYSFHKIITLSFPQGVPSLKPYVGYIQKFLNFNVVNPPSFLWILTKYTNNICNNFC